ncbi:MAG: tRNA pseudouridine(55) synthase TruB [Deltaproteobacteria bacterium GWC2_42_51]|nr:MAG: tRNA pseudouridine(55) synthase TruB [Deltaproteobacteria bacterium GWA2_42_85]OGP32878.1 MAG: tRNA pseudouridine(55) synthase TruB [Deltaproteobacteria bacterium GWC2_42_51]OGP40715.1 MAG: tRNA pseudouridine(55) synthase TruB [Deltaproteobacteria bacterium GWD2_42_10]OGP47270.1 MAG: tRNA pseudouridine(55) synthase TruB [Deltaproteobacteria bacterium GWF2_42_12]OGQ25176.1 MAG: tRNA pseudouridine(55) synthase TruB [Deltaproteobacteria bacterium RIFCSPHIGHO2_02_FULL_42_44]OGQ36191.1 MAG:
MTGVLVIDKPAGFTSHDIVTIVKRKLGARKVGHTGTLDPIATGVLPLCINDATRLTRFIEDGRKEYLATIKLGEETDTYDTEGKIIAKGNTSLLTHNDIISAVNNFRGKIEQIPPIFSAIKRNGVPLYKLARQGIEVERRPRIVEIYDIEIKNIAIPFVDLRVECSRGTYIRSLAFDIGRRLGCGAHLFSLRRTKNGPFALERSISMEQLNCLKDSIEKNIIPIGRLFTNIPGIEVDVITAERILNGISPKFYPHSATERFIASINESEMVRFTTNGRMIALATYRGEDSFKLERVFKRQ